MIEQKRIEEVTGDLKGAIKALELTYLNANADGDWQAIGTLKNELGYWFRILPAELQHAVKG